MIYYVELIGLKWSLTLVSMAGFGYTYFNSDYDFGLCSSLFFRGISCLYKHYGVGDICPERQLVFPCHKYFLPSSRDGGSLNAGRVEWIM